MGKTAASARPPVPTTSPTAANRTTKPSVAIAASSNARPSRRAPDAPFGAARVR
jgi:hypothetical protein